MNTKRTDAVEAHIRPVSVCCPGQQRKVRPQFWKDVDFMKLISQKIERRIKLALLATGALALLPVFSTSAQADPPSHAPAHGYGKAKKDKSEKWDKKHRRDDVDWRDRDNDDDWRDRDRRRDDDWRDRDRRNRDDDWRNRNGGHNGSYGGGYNGGRSRYTITGTVSKSAGGNQFWVRGDNGQGYLVVTRSQASVINEGMRVQVTGQFDGTRIIADSVRALGYASGNNNGGVWTRPGGNSGGGYNPGYNPGYNSGHNNDYSSGNVNFPAYIQSVSHDAGVATLRVRGDNGQTYNVRVRSNTRFYNGQRVRVLGRYNDGWVWATSVR
jgi:outer membrane lipoprotein SlyB